MCFEIVSRMFEARDPSCFFFFLVGGGYLCGNEGDKFGPNWRDSNPDPCDAGAVLYQLRYQANWALVVMWVD